MDSSGQYYLFLSVSCQEDKQNSSVHCQASFSLTFGVIEVFMFMKSQCSYAVPF